MHSKQPYHNLMSGAPSNEIKDELRKQRRMRSRRFYECRGAELLQTSVPPLQHGNQFSDSGGCMLISMHRKKFS